MSSVRDKLRAEVMAADLAALAPHCERGALLLLATELDILEVAEAMASDDKARIAALLSTGKLVRAGVALTEDLERAGSLRYQFVVVQPWVLAQQLP